jgi:RimJ/RimL family protein N-acetyltransferase
VLIDIGDQVIRSFRRDDVAALVKYANNRNVSANLMERFPFPYTEANARRWLELVAAMEVETAFAIADADELIGGIGLMLREEVFRRTAEVGFWLGEPFWNRGIATRAVRAMVDWGFSELDLERIQARVFEENRASARVLEKAGFSYEGRLRRSVTKRGRTFDQFVYAIFRHAAGEELPAENRWTLPAAWRARVDAGLVSHWQIYADNEPVRQLMASRQD